MLWPAGQARVRADHGRPVRGPVCVRPLRATVGPPGPWPSPGARLGVLGVPFAAVLAATVLLTVVATITVANAEAARRLERSGVATVGEVVGHEGDDTVVVLRYGDEPGAVTRAPADFASWYPRGIRFPMRVDPDDPARARLDAEPYDATEPVVSAAVPLVVALYFFLARVQSWRGNAAAAETGPWWEASTKVLVTGAVTTTLGITNGEDEVVCAVRTPSLQHQGDQHLLVVAAGESEPGAPVALWECTGAPITVAGPAEAPEVRDG